MADQSHSLLRSRREFLRRIAITVGALTLGRRIGAQSPPPGGRSGFARLITPGPHWNVHQQEDQTVARFIAEQTHIAFAPETYTVSPANLAELCAFPLLFTNDLTPVTDSREQANLVEYVRRGGFIYVDGCVEWKVTPSFEAFYRRHVDFFGQLFPGARLQPLAENHPIFRSYFRLEEADIRNGHAGPGHWDDLKEALYAVFDDRRMIGLVSLDHLRCGWPNDREKMTNCLKLIANIYVYVMTR